MGEKGRKRERGMRVDVQLGGVEESKTCEQTILHLRSSLKEMEEAKEATKEASWGQWETERRETRGRCR